MPKRVVNDPQGVTVKHGLNSLGFTEVSDVRVGKHIEVRLDSSSEEEARARVEEMCGKLLANGVIEDYRFEIEPDEGEASLAPTGEGTVGAEWPQILP
jgi:phosphoribosylformylglycinamidine synthase